MNKSNYILNLIFICVVIYCSCRISNHFGYIQGIEDSYRNQKEEPYFHIGDELTEGNFVTGVHYRTGLNHHYYSVNDADTTQYSEQYLLLVCEGKKQPPSKILK